MDYAMDNTQILSPQPSIDEALEFLGMSSMEKAMGIQALLRISEFDALSLYFDEQLICVPTSVKYGDQYDEEGEFVETLLIGREDEREFWSEHILDSFQLHKPSDNSFDLVVRRIIHDGISYHISQSDGTLSEGVSIGYDKFYFDREELIEYKAGYTAHFSENQKSKELPTKKTGIQEQRITALKYWLVGNSGKSIHDYGDLQSCYESLGEPTKTEVWKRLNLMDNKLFGHGQDEFLKVMSSVIQVKQGTGKHRDC
jgi:hypothetical protein